MRGHYPADDCGEVMAPLRRASRGCDAWIRRVASGCLLLGSLHLPALAEVQQGLIQDLKTESKNVFFGLAPLANSSYLPAPSSLFWTTLLQKTDGLINGKIDFPYLIPLISTTPNSLSMQTQAILDAPYTRPNLFQLADGFGSKLGQAYQARATWQNPGSTYTDSKQAWTEISPAVTKLIWFAGSRLRDSNLESRVILGTGKLGEGTPQNPFIDYSADLSARNIVPGVIALAYGLPTPGGSPGYEQINAYSPTPGAVVYPTGSYSGTAQLAPPSCGTGLGEQSCNPVVINDIQFNTGGFNVRPFEVAAYSQVKSLGLGLTIPSFYALNYNTDYLVNPGCVAGAAEVAGGCKNYNSNFAYFFEADPPEGGPPIPQPAFTIGFDGQVGSSSYASGHAIYGWYGGLLMGMLVPEAFQKMQTRGAENALGRVIGGWHWPTDVIGSRTMANFGVAQMLAGEDGYYGSADLYNDQRKVPAGIGGKAGAPYKDALASQVPDTAENQANCSGSAQGGGYICIPKGDPLNQNSGFVQVLKQAQSDMAQALTAQCASSLQACAAQDTSRFADQEVDRRFYEATLTLGLPRVYSETDLAGYSLDFNIFSPSTSYLAWRGADTSLAQEQRYAKNAGYLLLTRFPYLTLEQRNDVLTTTVVPDADGKGTFLDNGSAFGAYSRINLFKAADGYGRFDQTVTVAMDASLGGFNAADTWSNNIGGPGGLTKNGTGSLTLSGQNTFAGPITINGGRLDIRGSVTASSGVVVNTGVIGGNGSLPAVTINPGGTIAPGNSIGTINVPSLNLNGGALQAEIQGPQADLVNVNGAVSGFAGVANLVSYGGGSPFPGFLYTLVAAPNSADFATSNSLSLNVSQVSSALLQAGTTLVQNPLGHAKTFAVQWRPNHPVGAVTAAMQATGQGSRNSFAAAASLDRSLNALTQAANGNVNNTGTAIGVTGFSSGQAAQAGLSSGFVEALNQFVLLPSTTQLVSAVNSLAPQAYAAFQSVGLNTLKQQRGTVLAQAGQCRQNGWMLTGKNAKQPLCAFALAQNSSSDVRGNASLSSYGAGVFASGFGLEYYPSKQWSVGLGYGYGTSYANQFASAPASVTSAVNSVNLFADYSASERWRLRGLLGYSRFSINGSRSLNLPGSGSDLTANTTANGLTAAIETDYSLPLTRPADTTQVMLRPLLGLAWGSYQQSGFSEAGGSLGLSVSGNTANSLVTTAGVELATSPIAINRSGSLQLRPSLLLAYQVDALANHTSNQSLNASFSEAPAAGEFSTEGQNLGVNTLNISGGVELLIGDGASLYANATYQPSSNASQFGYGGGVRVRF